MQRRYLAILGVLAVLGMASAARAQDAAFDSWLNDFKAKAVAAGISRDTVEEVFQGVTPDDVVVRLDQKQPEKKITLTKYLENTVTPKRIARGRELLEQHREMLEPIGRKYGVQPRFIVALWGIETDYGNNTGGFSVIQSLATLAYEGRRAEFFSNELLEALRIMDQEHFTGDVMTGSWAGAMGNCQFMPSTYMKYAVDGDGNGTRDIWESHPDFFASIANYLHGLDWDRKQGWGRAVRVPHGFSASEADIAKAHTSTYWAKRGLTYANGKPVRPGERKLYAIYPGTEEEGVYLVTENFKALLQWNRSRYFATAVGTLADAIGE